MTALVISRKMVRTLIVTSLLIINIGCDQVSKTIVRQNVDYSESLRFVNDRVTLTKIENTGAFLSLGDRLPQPIRVILLIIFPIIVLTAGLWYVFSNESLSLVVILGICLVIGGGLGNLYDRVAFGSVTDFLHIDFGLFQTGIFNLADASIMIGLAILTASYSLYRKKFFRIR